MANTPPVMRCLGCGKSVDILDLFPKNRCLDCHSTAPEVVRELRDLTGEKLSTMWVELSQ